MVIRTEGGEVPGVIDVEPNWYPGRDAATTPAKFPEPRIDVGAADAE